MIITLIDVSICALLFPVIEAAFAEERLGFIFNHNILCDIWAFLWWLFPQASVLLVAMLSLSRLVVLYKPQLHLKPWIAFSVPIAFFLLILVVYICGLSLGSFHPAYFPDWLYCAVLPIDLEKANQGMVEGGNGTSRLVTAHEWNSNLFLFFFASFMPLLSFVLITISFFLSFYRLRQSQVAAEAVGGSKSAQRRAAFTVIIITLIYIVCNIPSTLALVALFLRIIQYSSFHTLTLDTYLHQFFSVSSSNSALSRYIIVSISLLPVGINSFVNPFVYASRMVGIRNALKASYESAKSKSKRVTAAQRITFSTNVISKSI